MKYYSINEVPKNKLFIVHGYEKVLNKNGFYFLNGKKYLLYGYDEIPYKEGCFYEDGRKYTICGILINKKLFLGLAVCDFSDDFSKEVGVQVAFEKAINSKWFVEVRTNSPKEVRDFINSYAGYIIEKNLDSYKDINKEIVECEECDELTDEEIANSFEETDFSNYKKPVLDDLPF